MPYEAELVFVMATYCKICLSQVHCEICLTEDYFSYFVIAYLRVIADRREFIVVHSCVIFIFFFL